MASGKYDIPGKTQILADHPNIRDHVQLIAEVRHPQFAAFPQNEPGASRARVDERGEHFTRTQAAG